MKYVDPDGREIFISEVDKAIVDYINKYSFYQYKLNEDGYLERGFSKPNNENNSRDYSYKIDQAIKSDCHITIRISNMHITPEGYVYTTDLNNDAGGGATSYRESLNRITITINSAYYNNYITVIDKSGQQKEIKESPEEILIHELADHAVPMLLQRNGNAIQIENYIRLELNLNIRLMEDNHSCY